MIIPTPPRLEGHPIKEYLRIRICLGPWTGLALVAGMVCFCAGQAAGAELETALHERVSRSAAGEFIPVLVKMAEAPGDLRELPGLVRSRRSLAANHTWVTSRLKDRARSSQHELSTLLTIELSGGRARSVRSFWIDNLVGLEASPSLILDLSERADIERIILVPEVVIDEPEESPLTAATAVSLESGVAAIGAPAMWAQGYTGKGRIVCNIDTGVRGTHFALADRWRGLEVPWQQAWFDPRGLTTFPADIGTAPVNHGSHTMGTMCGADTVRGDTVGVAIGAQWIAAFGIGAANLTTVDLIECLEWAADPDGNPNTSSDVPDAINCSWRFATTGIVYPCNDIMDGVIENLEAAGVIVAWAAGNEGSAAGTIGYPANSGTSFGTNFAVGSFNVSTDLLHPTSSRGPTPCTGDNIKPEVVAPGVLIRSCYRGNDSLYGILSGTSMSSPHVAGAAAILRQLAPNATPAEVKQALFVSATDKGVPGEDNDYGKGLINLPAAADSLSVLMGGPDLRVESEQLTIAAGLPASGPGDSLHAGDTVSVTFRIRNRSESPATGAYLKLVETDPYITLLVDSMDLGIVAAEDSTTAGSLRFVVNATTPAGQPLDLRLYLGAVGYLESHPLLYHTDPAPVRSQFTHDNTLVTFTVSNNGLYGLSDLSYYPQGGSGFLFDPSTVNHLAEAALVIGRGPTQVSDAARRAGGADAGYQIPDADFAPSPGGAILQISNMDSAFQTTFSVFDDAAAESPIGIRVKQWSLIFPRGADEGYVLLIYTLENISGGPLSDVYAGILHDCDFPTFLAGSDTTGYNAAESLAYMFDKNGVAAGPYRGVAVVSPGGATAYRSINAQVDFYAPGTYEVILSDSAKWGYLSGGIGPGSAGTGSFGDAGTFVGTGPIQFPSPGDTVQIAFAFVGSEEGLGRLVQHTQAARSRYDAIRASVAVTTDYIGPRGFTLFPNTPNPFNPDTRIAFTLSQPALARLTVYNLLGQEVVRLLEASLPAGVHQVPWNGRDHRNNPVASGVYFYRLQAGEQTQTRKMLLLR